MPTKTAKKKTGKSANAASAARRKVKSATTTNRKNVSRPKKTTTAATAAKNTAAAKKTTTKKVTEKKAVEKKKVIIAEETAVEIPAPEPRKEAMPAEEIETEEKVVEENAAEEKATEENVVEESAPEEKVMEVPVIIEKAPEIILETETYVGTPETIEQAVEEVTRMTAPTPSSDRKVIDMTVVNKRMEKRSEALKNDKKDEAPKKSSREIKENAIKKAMYEASVTPEMSRKQRSRRSRYVVHFGFKRVVLALACATAAVFAIVYFVNLNAPDITLKVAAMQTGIDARYPGYVPRDFALSDITSENGKITLNFRNASTGDAYSIIEEKSSWDSNALYSNYVEPTYGANATTVKEQGLTLYISGSDAAWTNGGVVYKLKMISGSLTKKQIKAIAVSL